MTDFCLFCFCFKEHGWGTSWGWRGRRRKWQWWGKWIWEDPEVDRMRGFVLVSVLGWNGVVSCRWLRTGDHLTRKGKKPSWTLEGLQRQVWEDKGDVKCGCGHLRVTETSLTGSLLITDSVCGQLFLCVSFLSLSKMKRATQGCENPNQAK